MGERPEEIAHDVEAIARIAAVPTLLQALCDMTGMGFAAVARVRGTISVTSERAEGTRFTVRIPLGKATPALDDGDAAAWEQRGSVLNSP